ALRRHWGRPWSRSLRADRRSRRRWPRPTSAPAPPSTSGNGGQPGWRRRRRGNHRDSSRRSRRHRADPVRSEEHTSELQSRFDLVCRLLLEKKKILSHAFFYILFYYLHSFSNIYHLFIT